MMPSSKIKPSFSFWDDNAARSVRHGIGKSPGSIFQGSDPSSDSKYNSIEASEDVIGPATGGTMYFWVLLFSVSASVTVPVCNAALHWFEIVKPRCFVLLRVLGRVLTQRDH